VMQRVQRLAGEYSYHHLLAGRVAVAGRERLALST